MEINSFKQPELVALIEKEFKGKSSRYDVRPREEHLSVTDLTSMMGNTKHINYQDLQPEKIYALKTTTTDLQTGKQDTSFNLFLDRKMAETYYFQNTPKDNLILNHQVQHGIIISGDVNNDLLARIQMAPKDFNSILVVSTMQADSFTNTQKQQIEQASKIAEKVFNEIPLKNEYAFDTLPKGAQQDLYKYYEMTHGENRQITHVDAYAIQEKKEAIQINEPYTYIGLIHSKDHSTPSIAYTNEHDYLNAIEQGLKNNPQNLGYETISQDPQLHKDVNDIIYRHFGINNPHPFEYYTIEGQPIKLDESNNPQITIMDLAKELGFTYRNTNGQGDIIMQKIVQPNENKPQITQIDLTIENAENPLKNTVTVDYSSFNDSKSMVQGPNFNPIAQDSDFHLSFNEFVALTKPLNSEEIVKRMENQATNAETLPLDIDFLKDTFLELKKQESHKQDTSVNGQLYNKVLDTLFEYWGKEPEKSIPIAKELVEYAKLHTDNEFANQIVENYNKTNGIKPENTETKQTVDFTPKSDFHYETSSIKPQTALIAEMMEKYSLDRSTINHFVDFMEAAHPIDRPGTDKTQDTIVFPYVKVDKDFNLESHIYSTMSSTFPAEAFKARSVEDYVGLDKTNAPIGYEHYTEGQKIPLQHHTNTAAIEGGTWMATTAKNPEDVKTVHIYNSAIDAMSEFELYKNKPNLNETAFVSVGTMAHNSQIRGIKELFPDATMYLNFQNNIMGELSTIKSVAVLADNPVNIKTDGRNIDFKLSDGLEFKLNAGMTNYKNFEKMSGINHLEIPNVTILRPRDGVTWNDTLKNFQQAQSRQEQQAERQERHHGMRM